MLDNWFLRGTDMQLFISIKNANTLPSRDEIKKAMWEKALSVSHALDLQEFNSLTLSWDKWIDDKRWSDGIPKSFEHINFEFQNKRLIIIDVDEDALFVDKRAFYRSAILIAERTNGTISTDNSTWIKVNEF
ncbi:hypothetical protein SAMN04487897_101935 [Paenibacillus sp. yr247]|nr:hypothetical protein SAMN04487897_101935 [Paenibacillus sp. yr247]